MVRARNPVKKIYVDLSTLQPVVGTWQAIVTAMDTPVSGVEIFNGSGSVLKLSIGASGQESSAELPYYVIPGTSSGMLPIEIPRGAMLSVTAVDHNVTDGSLVINCFG